MIIRNEKATDIAAITEVTIAAFNNHPISNQTEQFIIHALRAADVLTVSLVAEIDGQAVGHIAFSFINVSGKIGNASIRHGKIRLNGVIYRWLGNSEYIIDAELSNYLIEKEKIKRELIRIFLDFEKPFFTGGFHTSGSKFGVKEKMILLGIGVKLVKIMK